MRRSFLEKVRQSTYLIALAVLCMFGSVCCGRSPYYPGGTSSASLVHDISAMTVALVSEPDEDGDVLPFCSGVWIGPRTIVTAGHCAVRKGGVGTAIPYIIQSEVVGYLDPPKTKHLSQVTHIDLLHDVAILDAPDGPAHLVARWAAVMPSPGDTLHCVGQDHGWYWTYFRGVFSNILANVRNPFEISGPFLQISAPVSSGMSGSGAFDDTGRLVGILSMTVGTPDVALYIHLDSITRLARIARVQG